MRAETVEEEVAGDLEEDDAGLEELLPDVELGLGYGDVMEEVVC